MSIMLVYSIHVTCVKLKTYGKAKYFPNYLTTTHENTSCSNEK